MTGCSQDQAMNFGSLAVVGVDLGQWRLSGAQAGRLVFTIDTTVTMATSCYESMFGQRDDFG